MLFRKDIFVTCWFLLIPIIIGGKTEPISEDYFFGEMRAKDGYSCKDVTTLKKCNDRCGVLLGICYKKECYCVVKYTSDSATYTKPKRVTNTSVGPSRRHHIAHFCPDLDVARACIRKCMKEGKPAFCGKDHLCYCGHTYNGRLKKDKIDPEKVRNGFYDLYEKYFGPQYALTTTTEKHESEEKDSDPLGYKNANTNEHTDHDIGEEIHETKEHEKNQGHHKNSDKSKSHENNVSVQENEEEEENNESQEDAGVPES